METVDRDLYLTFPERLTMTSYCDFIRTDHLALLKRCSPASFKGYLIWWHKTHPRCQRLNSYESLWKCLRQIYYEVTHFVIPDPVGLEITNVNLSLRIPCRMIAADAL